MIGLEVVIFRALLVQAFLVIDEMETSLHPRLLELVLTHFLQKKSRSQLLVTTNYDPLLDEVNDILRKDMVWFTEKGEDGATELYSLADFKRLNTARSLCKHYRNGVLAQCLTSDRMGEVGGWNPPSLGLFFHPVCGMEGRWWRAVRP